MSQVRVTITMVGGQRYTAAPESDGDAYEPGSVDALLRAWSTGAIFNIIRVPEEGGAEVYLAARHILSMELKAVPPEPEAKE